MLQKTSLVTVGIPTYNRPEGLRHTLHCITKQTYQNLEIIVSDNCSTDTKVMEVLKEYAAKDSRIQFVVQSKNISIVPNFQYLLDHAKGDYFMWAADDDSWDLNFIEVCVNGLDANPDAVLAISDVRIVGFDRVAKDNCIDTGFMQQNLYSRLFHWIREKGENRYFFCGLYRTNIVKDIQFHNNWGGDHMFLIEAITKGQFLYLPKQSNFYYYRGGSSTTNERIKKAFNIKSSFYYSESYILRYVYYHFKFKHLNFLQKAGLFITNSLGLILNKEYLLYYALIKKPIMNLKQLVLQKLSGGKVYKPTYNQDGLTTLHNNGFMKEPDFIQAEKAGAATGSWQNVHWRVHTILWAAHQCKNIEGDFVECGTNKGGFAKAICEYLDFKHVQKDFYLLDTFKGLAETHYNEEEKKAGKKEQLSNVYQDCYEQVKATFASFNNVKIIRGTVPETLTEVKSNRIAFLSIDMNSVIPEIAALNYFWDKLSIGGMIVLDDYAFVTCDLQYAAHNAWAKEKGIKILSLPTGQGLIVK